MAQTSAPADPMRLIFAAMTSASPAVRGEPSPDRATRASGRFAPELEGAYRRSRLASDRTLVRMACLLSLILAGLRIFEVHLTGTNLAQILGPGALLLQVVILGASVLLAVLAWSPLYLSTYLPLADYLVPVRNVAAAIAVAAIGADRHVELLMLLPAMVISPFFFMGLHFRPALLAVVLTIVAFASTAAVFDMPTDVLVRVCTQLVMSATISAVAAWLLERQSRRNFLDARQLAQMAELDPLTGTRNRRVFEENLSRLWLQAIRDRRPLAVLLVDVDHFKSYNDRYGHQAGDLALQRVAAAIQGHIARPLDLLARYGGEEFGVLLYDTDAAAARQIAERIRSAVWELGIVHAGSPQLCITASIGIGAVQPRADRAPAGVVQLADEALYAAKMQGRDRIYLSSDTDYRRLQTGVFERPSLRSDVTRGFP